MRPLLRSADLQGSIRKIIIRRKEDGKESERSWVENGQKKRVKIASDDKSPRVSKYVGQGEGSE